MATLVLSAVGASIGGALGGSVLGVSSAILGRAVGATLGRVIDQRLLGQGSEVVPSGQVDRFHLTGASEGEPVAKFFGRVRIGGQVIWASRFREDVVTAGGSGKGTRQSSTTSQYTYSVSLALGLGQGRITRIGRVWADGVEISKDDLTLRIYPGDEVQLPDPKIEAVEGAGMAPSFRGTAYIVLEDLDLAPFGNRVPQFSFEILRRAQPSVGSSDPAGSIKGVALIPGTGEYGLATTAVHFNDGPGVNRSANVNSPSGKTDFLTSIESLREELEICRSVSLVVSWFGDDLRCGTCRVTPRVEQTGQDGVGMPWNVSGQTRQNATQVSVDTAGRPNFGGTPTDMSVIEAIGEIRNGGQEVTFYPFVLMDIQAGNGLTDPWSGDPDQPIVPWRGRITTSLAPEIAGSPDQSTAATAEVAAFFGTAGPTDFTPIGTGVSYHGPAEWSYRRFILHYAHLCALAGGVDAFCIGSELRSLTQIRGAAGSFPTVANLISLAADVRSILGPDTKISYASDWSEYFGYHPQDGSGDVLFHLDDLWASPDIDFVGIDNYMPLSDWRDKTGHLDEKFGSIYSQDYLTANIEGGEGFDWYYKNATERSSQIRSPIWDGNFGEDWVFRYKDLRSWWTKEHYNREGGQRATQSTAWAPQSKPFWFTEFGCAAIDKATNEPNVFLDAKSSESRAPHFSNGARDDLMQAQYLRAVMSYWNDPGKNPVSVVFGQPMIDMAHAHVWAWDARPWPEFPANLTLWSDGANYARGHWLNGRLGAQSLADIILEICEVSGVTNVDVANLYGSVKGYIQRDIDTARSALQPLMLAYGVDAVEREGTLKFINRSAISLRNVPENKIVYSESQDGDISVTRAPEAEMAGMIRLRYPQADGKYQTGSAEAVLPDVTARTVSQSDLPIVLSSAEAKLIVERWLAESRVARESFSFALPPSEMAIGAGDVVRLPLTGGGDLVRVDRVEDVGVRRIEATRVDPAVYQAAPEDIIAARTTPFVAPVPVYPLFLDLPLLTGRENPDAPHCAVTATPWPGSVAVYSASSDNGYVVNKIIQAPSTIGRLETFLLRAQPDRWCNDAGLRVRVFGGSLSSVNRDDVLNGANTAAIGPGSDGDWEVVQFTTATLIGPDTYQLSGLLRGQAGTEKVMPDSWPVGSQIVLLNGQQTQIDLAPSARDLARHYRVGSALRPISDASYIHEIHAFAGVGLRPYAPVQLRIKRLGNGDQVFSWIRRTRIDGDSWAGPKVPLGEASEAYQVKILDAVGLVREETVSAAAWTYGAAAQASDGISGTYRIEVAQISERFGAGSYSRMIING